MDRRVRGIIIGPESEGYYSEDYIYESESEGENGGEPEGVGGEDSGNGGMSTLEKALLASDVARMGSKVHG